MSQLEDILAFQIKTIELPEPAREFIFKKGRRWRFDFAWSERMIAVEIEGGVWSGGRHTRGQGFINDCDKYNAATFMGWRVYRFTEKHINSGDALKLLEDVFLS